MTIKGVLRASPRSELQCRVRGESNSQAGVTKQFGKRALPAFQKLGGVIAGLTRNLIPFTPEILKRTNLCLLSRVDTSIREPIQEIAVLTKRSLSACKHRNDEYDGEASACFLG
jgi:hypothetical protein